MFLAAALGAADQGKGGKLSCGLFCARMSCRVCGGFQQCSCYCQGKHDWCLLSHAASSFASALRCPSLKTRWCGSLWSVCHGTSLLALRMPWSLLTTWWSGLRLCKPMVRLHKAPVVTSVCPLITTQGWDSSYRVPESLCRLRVKIQWVRKLATKFKWIFSFRAPEVLSRLTAYLKECTWVLKKMWIAGWIRCGEKKNALMKNLNQIAAENTRFLSLF